MNTQDLNIAFMYESERRKDDLVAAQESYRVHQLLQDRPVKRLGRWTTLLLNLLLLTVTLFRRH